MDHGPAGGQSQQRECNSLARHHPGGSREAARPTACARLLGGWSLPQEAWCLCAVRTPYAGARLPLRQGEEDRERERERRKGGREEGERGEREGGGKEGREGRRKERRKRERKKDEKVGRESTCRRQEHLPNSALRKAAPKTLVKMWNLIFLF